MKDDPETRSDLDSAPYVPRSVVVHDDFQWGPDTSPHRRWRDTVIYEMHVKGMTALHDRVPEELRGTYAGLAAPAVTDYLKDLGVTAVELLPVHQFFSEPALAERGLVNYWGYNSLCYFAPHNAYAAAGDRGQQVTEFKQMVKDFHLAGLEVILDVVYNHTAEAGPRGPTLSFRGLDDRGYYQRVVPPPAKPGQDPEPVRYWDVTGCGNTVDATHTQSLRMILDSLRYWVTEMHVDGFRFDLMSALTRTDQVVDMGSHLLTAIGQDPVLRHVKLVAEPWDASMDGYRVGQFPPPWVEWNDQFRDTVRDFWRGHSGGVRTVATRLAGSSDLYADDGRSPYASVNFVTAHDGFTLRDLVSYNDKHNDANGEDNRDGTDNNRSWNCGVEGETDDPEIIALRRRQAANLMATLCFSSGVPMLTAGDERGRTQGGNNNAYGQDNETSWIDWRPDDAWLDVYEITKTALRLRREHPVLRQRHWFDGRPTIKGGIKDLVWVHPSGHEMTVDDWNDDSIRTDRDVPQRRSPALPRPARRAGARPVVHDLAQRRRRRRRAGAAGQPVGPPRRGRPVDQRRPRRRHPGGRGRDDGAAGALGAGAAPDLIAPGRQAGAPTHSIGSPASRSVMPRVSKAPSTTRRRTAAKVSTCATIPP